jgi:hypothetical protein
VNDAAKAGFDDAYIYNELKIDITDRKILTHSDTA